MKLVMSGTGSFTFAGDTDTSALAGQFVLWEIFRSVKARTEAERGQQQFGRSHTFIESAILDWLIARNEVSARTDLKRYGPKMFDSDFLGYVRFWGEPWHPRRGGGSLANGRDFLFYP
jgi:hypothetical protein